MATKRRSLDDAAPNAFANVRNTYCYMCGAAYSRQKGYFTTSHSPMYRAMGYIPWCNDCVDKMYEFYRQELGDSRAAVRRMCMKLDLYWSDQLYNSAERSAGAKSRMRNYIGKTNIVRYIDKTFDDTIAEEAAAQETAQHTSASPVLNNATDTSTGDSKADKQPTENLSEPQIEIPEEVKLFWGPGYRPELYAKLEDRRKYWMSKYPPGYLMDVGEEALIRQICGLELEVNQDRSAGKDTDKKVGAINNLIGSLNLKPNQKKSNESDSTLDNMPLGVGIWKWENTRPIPEPDPEFKDVNHIVWYINVFFLGHICKMLHIKNSYCQMYEDEMKRLRVERPEYEEEDDEGLFNNIFDCSPGGD